MNNRALVEACLRGEAGAWDEFIRRFAKLIHWSVRRTMGRTRFSGRHDLAADIFQEAFAKVFEKKDTLRLKDASALKKFLVVLAANLTLDRLKSLSRQEGRSVFLDEPAESGVSQGESLEAPGPGPADAAQSREKAAAVAEALEGLSPRERACVELSIFDGLSHREIGLTLGLEQENVSSIIRRAKEKVREKFVKKGFSS